MHDVAMTDPRPATAHIPPFGLRLQPELKKQLEEAAAAAGRSLNAEIAYRLEQTFQQPGDSSRRNDSAAHQYFFAKLAYAAIQAEIRDLESTRGAHDSKALKAAAQDLAYLDEEVRKLRRTFVSSVRGGKRGAP